MFERESQYSIFVEAAPLTIPYDPGSSGSPRIPALEDRPIIKRPMRRQLDAALYHSRGVATLPCHRHTGPELASIRYTNLVDAGAVIVFDVEGDVPKGLSGKKPQEDPYPYADQPFPPTVHDALRNRVYKSIHGGPIARGGSGRARRRRAY